MNRTRDVNRAEAAHPTTVAVRADVAAPARSAARGPAADVRVYRVGRWVGPLRGGGGGEQPEEPWSHFAQSRGEST